MGDVVLIADDDGDILRFVSLNLRLEGFDVVTAQDGEEALAKALHLRPSLILLDTMMPCLNGYEVCAGADDWVTKPFDPAELVSRVKQRLRAAALHGR